MRIAWVYLVALLLQPGAPAGAADPSLPAPLNPRYLFLIDTSAAMAGQKSDIGLALASLLRSGLNGQMGDGEVFAVWTFGSTLSSKAIPAAAWNARTRALIAQQYSTALDLHPFSGDGRMDTAIRASLEAVAGSQSLTVVLIDDAKTPLFGTPFADKINAVRAHLASQGPSRRAIIATTLLARGGKVLAWSVEPVLTPNPPDLAGQSANPIRQQSQPTQSADLRSPSGQADRANVAVLAQKSRGASAAATNLSQVQTKPAARPPDGKDSFSGEQHASAPEQPVNAAPLQERATRDAVAQERTQEPPKPERPADRADSTGPAAVATPSSAAENPPALRESSETGMDMSSAESWLAQRRPGEIVEALQDGPARRMHESAPPPATDQGMNPGGALSEPTPSSVREPESRGETIVEMKPAKSEPQARSIPSEPAIQIRRPKSPPAGGDAVKREPIRSSLFLWTGAALVILATVGLGYAARSKKESVQTSLISQSLNPPKS